MIARENLPVDRALPWSLASHDHRYGGVFGGYGERFVTIPQFGFRAPLARKSSPDGNTSQFHVEPLQLQEVIENLSNGLPSVAGAATQSGLEGELAAAGIDLFRPVIDLVRGATAEAQWIVALDRNRRLSDFEHPRAGGATIAFRDLARARWFPAAFLVLLDRLNDDAVLMRAVAATTPGTLNDQ